MQSNYVWGSPTGPSEADQLRTPGPGKIQLPDGRYVTVGSTLGMAFLSKQEEEKSRAQFDSRLSDLMQRADPFASQRGQYATQLSSLLGAGNQQPQSAPQTAAQPAGGQQMLRMSSLANMPGGAQPQPSMMNSTGQSLTTGNSTFDPTAAMTSNPQMSAVMNSNPFFKANADAGNEAASRRLAAMGMGTSGNAAYELQKQAQSNMSGEYFKMADLLSGLSGAKADPSAAANAGLGMLKIGEEARQYDYSNKWRQGIQPGQQGTLSAYWGK